MGGKDKMGISIQEAVRLTCIAPPDAILGFVGPPGFGKSSIPALAAKQMGWSYICRYLALMEAVEINGLPHLIESNGQMSGRWAPFKDLFPLADDMVAGVEYGTVLLCLDDLGQATPSVTKAGVRVAYGDGIDRMVGMHKLFPNTRICFTSNLHTHRAGAHRFESYVGNRVTVVEIEPDAREWATWAIAAGVHPSVIGYVSWSKQITDFDPAKDAFMSPRSLEKLGRFITALDANSVNGATLRAVTYGTIGEQAGSQFLAYHALADKLPDMDAVLRGDKIALPTKPEVQYMFVTSFIQAAKKEHVPVAARLINELTDAGATGFEVAAFLTFECLKGSGEHLRGIRTQPALYKWLSEFGKYLP
jgi:hypothetical protein